MTGLSAAEVAFLREHELCRFATVSSDSMPQVTPVIYAMDGESIVVAIDYGTKKLANLRTNPKASMVVDEYGERNEGVMVQGRCTILEKGTEYLRLLRVLFEKFETYRENPWSEGESPIIRLDPERVSSWGIGGT